MAIVTARAKPRQGWSTSLRNDDDDDDSDHDGSSSPSAAAPPAARQGSDWDWNWSSELIDIGLVDEPDQLSFVETPFTLAKRNALTNSNRASTETQTIANKKTKKKLATTPAASASANKSKPTAATTTTTPAPPLQPATLNKKKKKQNSPAAEAKQQAAPPVISEPPSPSSKIPLCSPPIPQQQSHEDATSSKARLISSSRFRPASASSPTVFSSSSSSQPASSSAAADKPLLATATATTETETEQAAPASAHRRLAAAVGLATTKSSATRHEQSSVVATPNLSSADRLQAVASSYSAGTTGQDPRVLIPKEVTMTGSSPSKQASTSTKDDDDGAESHCPLPRRRGREESLGGPSAPNINQLKRDAARPPFSNLPFVSPLMKRQQLDRHKMQSFREEEAGEGDARRLAFASSSPRSQSVNVDLLPRTRQVPHSRAQNVQGGQGQAPTSSSTAAAAVSSSTPLSLATTQSLPLRHSHEGISPETRKRLDRFKRVGNFSASSSSTTTARASAAASAAEANSDSGRRLPPYFPRRGDDDPNLDLATPMPDPSALQPGGPVNDDSARSSIRKMSTKFSLPGFGTAEGSSSSSILQIKKKRSRLDFTPDEPLEVFRQKKNAHGPASSSSPSPNGWNDAEPVSPSPRFPTGGPFQQWKRRYQEEAQQQQPRRETIVLGAAVRSVRPVSLATAAAAAATTGNNNNNNKNNNKLGTSSSSSLSWPLSLPKRQTGRFKRPLAAARTRPDFIIRGDDADDDEYQGGAARDDGRRESEDAKRRRLYRSLGL
ncbi:hypothetical protein RHOSPDRAFT_33828 [Rhodotorula sp. JG-1b]|nr:hypothetical protein RHOSPDRAFT_33828 [Rhodotorula sp. JG-1b]